MRFRGAYPRRVEAFLLSIAWLAGLLAFAQIWIARQIQQRVDPLPGLPQALLTPFLVGLGFFAIHALLVRRRVRAEELVLPIVAILFFTGLGMIYRLRGDDGLVQQVVRGFLPGWILVAVIAFQPQLVERFRRLALPIWIGGLALALLTAVFGSEDETGARLALRFGPLAIQTSELIKLGLIVFLAWFVEREGEVVEGRAHILLGWLRVPALRHFAPGFLFVGVATLALVVMSDYGAVLILGFIFVAMLFAGFDSRLFFTVASIGLVLALLVGVTLGFTWNLPSTIENRFIAFLNPWSTEELMVNGQPTGLTISEGPGYQIQQSIYATLAGGMTGTGLGFGSPEYIPLGASDFIFASILEELGTLIGISLLVLYILLVLRIMRTAVLLPREQVFERLLLVGIAVHFFTQVFVMVGGTVNLIPLTGVTLPFLSLGGAALLVNLFEAGLALVLAQRLEGGQLA